MFPNSPNNHWRRTPSDTSFSSLPSTHTSQPRGYRHEPYALASFDAADEESVARIVSISCRGSSAVLRRDSTSTFQPWATPQPSETSSTSVGAPVYYYVTFKYGEKVFCSPNLQLATGECVVVEGDRGVDLGFVRGVAPFSVYASSQCPSILRIATEDDKEQHQQRRSSEDSTLPVIQQLARDVECTGIVEDIMIQLDGAKITVVISRPTKEFVDFRRLQRAAFDVFRCRVWFAYLDEIEETKSTEVQKSVKSERAPPKRPYRRNRRAVLQM